MCGSHRSEVTKASPRVLAYTPMRTDTLSQGGRDQEVRGGSGRGCGQSWAGGARGLQVEPGSVLGPWLGWVETEQTSRSAPAVGVGSEGGISPREVAPQGALGQVIISCLF